MRKKKKFLRVATKNFKKLGRKKKQKWRKPRGHDNKIRLKRKGRPKKVEIGYKKSEREKGKINGKIPLFIRNLKEAEKINRGELVIIAKIGKKKRLRIEKKVEERGGKILKPQKSGGFLT